MEKIGWILVIVSLVLFLIELLTIGRGGEYPLVLKLRDSGIVPIMLFLGIILLFVGLWRDQKKESVKFSFLNKFTKVLLFINVLFYTYLSYSILDVVYLKYAILFSWSRFFLILIVNLVNFVLFIKIFQLKFKEIKKFILFIFVFVVISFLAFFIFLVNQPWIWPEY